MTTPIYALRDAIHTVSVNIRFVAITGLLLVVTTIVTGALTAIPGLGVFAFEVVPGVVGAGIVGAIGARSGTQGSALMTLSAFRTQIRTHAKELLGVYVLSALIYIILTLILLSVAVGGGAILTNTSVFTGAGDTVTSQISGLGVASLVVVPLTRGLVSIPFQFLNVAVVIEDRSITGAYERALNIVRNNPRSVLGYSLIRGIFVLTGYVALVRAIVGPPVSNGLPLGVIIVVGIGVASVLVSIFHVYHVEYYRQLCTD